MDKQLKRLRDARKEFEAALNEFVGMEVDVKIGFHWGDSGQFARNEKTGPWKVLAKVIIDSERVTFEDDF